MRLSATKALIERKDAIIIATVSAIYGLGDPDSYLRMVLHLSRGEHTGQRKILTRLAEMQYQRSTMTLERGQFRVNGDVVDVFPADSERDAIRIELFDEEVENISVFDPLTGEIQQRVPRVTIFPKTHFVTPRERILETIDLVKEELHHRLVELHHRLVEFNANNKLVEAQRLEQRTYFDIEMMS